MAQSLPAAPDAPQFLGFGTGSSSSSTSPSWRSYDAWGLFFEGMGVESRDLISDLPNSDIVFYSIWIDWVHVEKNWSFLCSSQLIFWMASSFVSHWRPLHIRIFWVMWLPTMILVTLGSIYLHSPSAFPPSISIIPPNMTTSISPFLMLTSLSFGPTKQEKKSIILVWYWRFGGSLRSKKPSCSGGQNGGLFHLFPHRNPWKGASSSAFSLPLRGTGDTYRHVPGTSTRKIQENLVIAGPWSKILGFYLRGLQEITAKGRVWHMFQALHGMKTSWCGKLQGISSFRSFSRQVVPNKPWKIPKAVGWNKRGCSWYPGNWFELHAPYSGSIPLLKRGHIHIFCWLIDLHFYR